MFEKWALKKSMCKDLNLWAHAVDGGSVPNKRSRYKTKERGRTLGLYRYIQVCLNVF